MKSLNGVAMVLALTVVVIMCPSVSVADMSQVRFDFPGEGDSLRLSAILPFEDNSLSGHSAIAAWLEVFPASSITADLSEDVAILELLSDDLTVSALAVLSAGMRAGSGYRLTDAAQIYFASGNDFFCFTQYGQGNLIAPVTGVRDWPNGHSSYSIDLTQWPSSPWPGWADAEWFQNGAIFGKMID